MDAVIQTLQRRSEEMPLHEVKNWQPFKIDALGLVTLLGAEEVNQSIGTLQRRRYTEYLPLLAAFLVAGDRFTAEQAGYSLYNLTDGIHTTELKGWFTRWLSTQKLENSSTSIFTWEITEDASGGPWNLAALALSVVTVMPLLVFTILIGDWFGVGNSIAIIASIMVRVSLLSQRRQAVEIAATHGPKEDQKDIKKLFVTRADGAMVTIYAPKSVVGTFTRDSGVPDLDLYHFVRWIGWATFGAHICILGMSSLFTQIYTVALLVISTWWLCSDMLWDIGRQVEVCGSAADNWKSEFVTSRPFGSKLKVVQENPGKTRKGTGRRLWAYVRAEPDEEQEAMLKHWTLLPFEYNKVWYNGYDDAKQQYARAKSSPVEAKKMYGDEEKGTSEKASVQTATVPQGRTSSESARPGAAK
ncbi:hypothetical protein LTR36_009481 [Oleoguttula mirabilis]|uniref:Uncharacterized protein n=1 Tax=Oleoguttula mirabilis TaxID=1507867 RepID=A0AAV9JSM2_9PEZI|nr:hypothetical protein LTR36_009481 [Oleoguttula mirabilis]